jgi:transcription elongation factor Elf1
VVIPLFATRFNCWYCNSENKTRLFASKFTCTECGVENWINT